VILLAGCTDLKKGGIQGEVMEDNLPDLPFGSRLQEILDDTMAQFDAGKGISAAVIVPGYQPWVGESGISHGATPITPETVFDAGSTHKNFTAAAVLLLAEEGVLTLDDPVNKWLPEYPNIDGEITIRQLLNHTGGVYDMVRHPDYWDAIMSDTTHVWEREEILNNFLLEPYFPRGEGWHYSTPGYILLRMIIEEAAGEDLAAIYHTYLWDDLPLENTYLATYEDLPEDTAHGWFHLDGDGIYDELPSSVSFNTSTGGAIFTTSEDLAIWADALYHEKRVLSEDLLSQMLTFEPTTSEEPLLVGYGLGVVNYSPEIFNGQEIYGHSGNAAGYTAASLYLPEYGISLGIMLNTHDGPMIVINDLLTTVIDYLDENPQGGLK
jgi:CubicO group peptidase (beta-lactamase class C family)